MIEMLSLPRRLAEKNISYYWLNLHHQTNEAKLSEHALNNRRLSGVLIYSPGIT